MLTNACHSLGVQHVANIAVTEVAPNGVETGMVTQVSSQLTLIIIYIIINYQCIECDGIWFNENIILLYHVTHHYKPCHHH